MNKPSRAEIASILLARIHTEQESLKSQYETSQAHIGYFILDNLLPIELASSIYKAFPLKETMMLKKSIREHKYVTAQMDRCKPILEETIYAFQDSRIVKAIQDICTIPQLIADEHLYAGGLSLMTKDNFLNPHLDNSHDKDRNRWRALNLLYYTTPDWRDNNGGHLEIWPKGLDHAPVTLHSRFNRLVVMATHHSSWHSVSPITEAGNRCCISNYYFSPTPIKDNDDFHVTSFRGRPEEPVKDKILQADTALRMGIRKVFKKGIVSNPHVYKKKPDTD